VDHELEVHMVGGIRSGPDVLKPVALGAKSVYYMGSAMLYGRGAFRRLV